MKLALFDLDNTLLAGDSGHAWGDWLCEKGILDKQHFKLKSDEFYQQYLTGTLNITEYLNFSLAILGQTSITELNDWHNQFMEECIEPIILKKAEQLLAKHCEQGDKLVIITAANRFVTAPIAKRLKVHELIATECEMINNMYTGKPTGIPCFQQGKVTRLNNWLKNTQLSLENSYFYSDSINDLPLLSLVTNPVAVDPDNRLRAVAESRNWPIISLQN